MNGIAELQIEGRIATPDDADWEAARQAWNLAADPHPSAAAFVESAADVAAGAAPDSEREDIKEVWFSSSHSDMYVGRH